MKFKAVALTSILLAFSLAVAQQMGSVNRDAPSIQQKIEFADGSSVSLDYKAITFGGGQWAKALANPEQQGTMRDRINAQAERGPLGKLTTSIDMEIGGKAVTAGEYTLGFMVSESFGWQMVAASGDSKVTWDLELMDSPMSSPRLLLGLYAGEDAHSAGIYLAFGEKSGDVEIKPLAQDGN